MRDKGPRLQSKSLASWSRSGDLIHEEGDLLIQECPRFSLKAAEIHDYPAHVVTHLSPLELFLCGYFAYSPQAGNKAHVKVSRFAADYLWICSVLHHLRNFPMRCQCKGKSSNENCHPPCSLKRPARNFSGGLASPHGF